MTESFIVRDKIEPLELTTKETKQLLLMAQYRKLDLNEFIHQMIAEYWKGYIEALTDFGNA